MEESTPNTPNTPDTPNSPSTPKTPGGRRAAKRVPVGLIAGLTVAALAAAVVGGYFGLCAWVKDNGCLLPGTVAVDDRGEAVADLDKLSREDALELVSQEMDQRLGDRKLTLLYGDGKKKELTGELMNISPEAAVEAGFSAKGEQPLWKLGALWLGAVQEPCQMSLSAAAFTQEGEAQAKRVIQSIADEVRVDPVDFTYEVKEETVTVTPGTDGQKLDTDALLAAVEEALAQGETELRVETEAVPGAELSGTVIRDLVHVEPQAPGVDKDGKLTPAIIGRTVDAQEAQKLLDAAAPGESVEIPLALIPPDTTGDERLYYKDLLAEVTTNMDGVANRSFNVNRAASFCNGKVIQPGEVFSYIGTIGNPSTGNGYKPSTGYQNGETVAMDGGGVCQVSSSLYYCAVYSNLEIVKRACHAFSTGYIPNGLDATIYYPSLDFKFRNNTGFPIKIVAYCEGGAWGKLTVQFYGSNPDGIHVETQRYTQSSTAWTTVYQPDETIRRGTTTVKITPYTGYVVDVYRCVYDANGKLISRTFENHSKYNKRDKVILYNPADEGPWGPGVDPGVDPGVEPTPEIPPVTEPPVTEPPVTEPPVTDPPVTDPPETEPPVEPTPEPPPTQYIDLPGGETGA